MKSHVLVTDGHWRKCLAAVRSLGRKGIRVTVGETTRLATAAFSKFCSKALIYPSPIHHPSRFIDFLYREVSRGSYQMLLPMEDETLDIIAQHHSDFSRFTSLPIPPLEKLRFARNKDKVLGLAEKLGVPTPKTWRIRDLSQLNGLKDILPYPVVIKPRVGSGARGLSYPQNGLELEKKYLQVHRRFPYPLIQELIPPHGPGYGASFLMNGNGEVKACFVHKRLREYPVTGGASTLRKSVRRDDVRDMGLSLLKALDWYGVAMVEFKVDPRHNIPKLMEINPRFWGSLPLAIAAGVDFPYLLYRLCLGEDFSPVLGYPLGKKCRWLLPGDLLHFLHNPKRARLLPDFFDVLDHHTSYDIISASDPLPVLGRILTPLTFLYDLDMKHRLKERAHGY